MMGMLMMSVIMGMAMMMTVVATMIMTVIVPMIMTVIMTMALMVMMLGIKAGAIKPGEMNHSAGFCQ